MNRYEFTAQAERDLQEIHEYIAKDNPRAAKRFIDTLEEKCRTLADFPDLGEACESFAPSLRRFVVRNYAIFYHTIEGGIRIVPIVSGARDIDALFGAD